MTGISRKLCLVLAVASLSTSAAARAQAVDEASPSPPSAAEQERLLATMRQYAEQYVANLPNFICFQVTEQFEAGRKTAHWHRGDTLTSKLVFVQGREKRSLELVNDKPPKWGGRSWRTPLTSEGEFGMLLNSIFGEASSASFTWNSWDLVGGKRVAVFDYAIDKDHSTLSLSLSDLARAIVPYHGSVYADAATGAVWRITNRVTEIPPQIQTKSISTTIEYQETAIGSANYLLPVQASVQLSTGANNIRNEIRFKDYRKFEADSTITYSSGSANTGAAGRRPNLSNDPPPP